PAPIAVEGLEPGREFVGAERPFDHLGRPGAGAELDKSREMFVAAGAADRLAESHIRIEQIDVLEWRRLVGDLMRRELRARPQCTHDVLPSAEDRTVFLAGVNPMKSITRRRLRNGLRVR